MKRSIKSLLATLVVSLSLVVPVMAGPFVNGLTVIERHDFAMFVHHRAEELDPIDQAIRGLMYATGKGVPQDYDKAAVWWRKAAERGSASAQYGLGTLYVLGKGVQRDYVKAYKWLSLSAAQERKDAAELRELISPQMTPAQIAEAQRLAREWKPKK